MKNRECLTNILCLEDKMDLNVIILAKWEYTYVKCYIDSSYVIINCVISKAVTCQTSQLMKVCVNEFSESLFSSSAKTVSWKRGPQASPKNGENKGCSINVISSHNATRIQHATKKTYEEENRKCWNIKKKRKIIHSSKDFLFSIQSPSKSYNYYPLAGY